MRKCSKLPWLDKDVARNNTLQGRESAQLSIRVRCHSFLVLLIVASGARLVLRMALEVLVGLWAAIRRITTTTDGVEYQLENNIDCFLKKLSPGVLYRLGLRDE